MKKTRNHTRGGYNLTEVLAAIGVFVLILGVSLPYLGNFYRNQNVGAYCKKVRQAIYRAEYRSIAGERGLPWGVRINAGNYVLFAGKSYVTRLTQFDELNDLPNTMSHTGLTEVMFSKYQGLPNTTGTVSIVLNSETTPCVTVTSSGLVD